MGRFVTLIEGSAKDWGVAWWIFWLPLFTFSSWFVLFSYKLIRFTVLPTSEFTITRYAEWPELCLAFALFRCAWLNYRGLTAQAKLEAPAALSEVAKSIQ